MKLLIAAAVLLIAACSAPVSVDECVKYARRDLAAREIPVTEGTIRWYCQQQAR